MSNITTKWVPPRLYIRLKDSYTGSYPTISRTGDADRSGRYKVFWDDTNTINFDEDVSINYALGLPESSKYAASSLLTDIQVNGTIRKGIFDNFIEIHSDGEVISPFNEAFRPEQSVETSFFMTGSRPSETTIGFSSKLNSKTQLKFSYPIDSTYQFLAQTASIAYFNTDKKAFEMAGGSSATSDPETTTTIGSLGSDCRLFNPFGLPIASGSSDFWTAFNNTSIDEAIDAAIAHVESGSVLLNTDFAATSSNYIPLSGVLDRPFLLEKAVVEFPISASDGWFNDTTVAAINGVRSDAGGPCITVSIFNQISDDRREIIVSGTIIPSTDNTSYALTTVGAQAVAGPAGFLSFGTPSAIIPSVGSHVVNVQMEAAIANGLLGVETAAGGGGRINDSIFAELMPYGRADDPFKPSARSVFGKEYATAPKSSSLKYNLSGVESNVYFYEKQAYSPYLLLPTDKLIFAVAKHRPVVEDKSSDQSALTGSHEVWIEPGTFNITLYGCQIQNGIEFHDTLNQNLTSPAIHEALHFDNPVIDQFDVETKDSFVGSYVAEYFTGSILNTNNVITGTTKQGHRAVRSSLIGTSNIVEDSYPIGNSNYFIYKTPRPGFHRNVQLVSENERYYDTLLPRADLIIKQNGGDIVYGSATGVEYALFAIGRTGLSFNYDYDQSWDFLFPFEASYSSIDRTVTPFRNIITTKNTAGSNFIKMIDNAGVARPEGVNNSLGTIDDDWELFDFLIQSEDPATPINFPLTNATNKAVAKALFGIGDAVYNSPKCTQLPENNAERHVDVEIRGFKYGIMNSSPKRKKYTFRRDRYGQFRDMLEQAKDSKIFFEDKSLLEDSPILRTFYDSDGNITSGENTFISNVSIEATSSLPYFDGVSRNRGDLPDTSLAP